MLNKKIIINTKQIFLRAEIIVLNWYKALILEYHGSKEAFFGALFYLLDENRNFTKQERRQKYKKLFNYVYGDFSYMKLYPGARLPIVYLYIFLIYVGLFDFANRMPAKYKVLNERHTSARDYLLERRAYKLYNRVAKNGHDLKKYAYDEYKLIANKYDWPIIYNSNDNTV